VSAPIAARLAEMGASAPFEIQEATLPDSLEGRDVLGQARTGSGKTIAFAIPIAQRLLTTPASPGRPRALVVVPTRELAVQVAATMSPLADVAGVRVATVFGGVPHGPQRAAIAAGVEILVACPGRLLDHVGAGILDLAGVEITVLDEADHMADQGFLPMVRRILDATDPASQRLLFSATLAGGVDALVSRYLSDPVTHRVADGPPAKLEHHVHTTCEDDKVADVARLCAHSRTVVFCRTKHRARKLARQLRQFDVPAVELHGNLSQAARQRNLAAFADGSASVLVATDIAARGIHVDDVPLVVHADPPIEHKAYTHRSGRTARAGAAGVVVTMCLPDQHDEVRQLLTRAKVTARWAPV
jgi:superfamily II DNA/RNA helicase